MTSLWDIVTASKRHYFGMHPAGQDILESIDRDAVFYNEADAAEDRVLFPNEPKSKNPKISLKELTNPISDMKTRSWALAHHEAECFRKKARERMAKARERGELPQEEPFDDPTLHPKTTTVFSLPRIWVDAVETLNSGHISPGQIKLLRSTGLLNQNPERMSYTGGVDVNLAKNIPTVYYFDARMKEIYTGKHLSHSPTLNQLSKLNDISLITFFSSPPPMRSFCGLRNRREREIRRSTCYSPGHSSQNTT